MYNELNANIMVNLVFTEFSLNLRDFTGSISGKYKLK